MPLVNAELLIGLLSLLLILTRRSFSAWVIANLTDLHVADFLICHFENDLLQGTCDDYNVKIIV